MSVKAIYCNVKLLKDFLFTWKLLPLSYFSILTIKGSNISLIIPIHEHIYIILSYFASWLASCSIDETRVTLASLSEQCRYWYVVSQYCLRLLDVDLLSLQKQNTMGKAVESCVERRERKTAQRVPPKVWRPRFVEISGPVDVVEGTEKKNTKQNKQRQRRKHNFHGVVNYSSTIE